MVEAGVAISTNKDGFLAGKEVANEALGGISTKPKLGILLVDHLTKKKFDYSEVLNGVIEVLGNETPIIGSTVNGILVNNRFALRSVGLMLLAGNDIELESEFMYGKSRVAYKKIASEIASLQQNLNSKKNRVMVMFQDGIRFPQSLLESQKMLNSRMVAHLSGIFGKLFKVILNRVAKKGLGMPSVQELLEDLYNKGWNIPIIGNMATNLDDYVSFEFYKDKVLTDSVLGAIISSDSVKFQFGFAAGAEKTEYVCHPTKHIGNFLLEIDKKPAIEGFANAVKINPESFRELKNQGYVNVYHILGLTEKVDEKEYYHLTGTITNPDLPNLIVTGFPFNYVPEEIQIFRSNTKFLLNTVKSAIEQAINGMSKPKFLFGLDCIVRMQTYGDHLERYINIVKETLGDDVPRMISGSGGEIFGTQKGGFYENNMTFLTFAGGN